MDDKKLVCKADYEAAKARGSYTNIDLLLFPGCYNVVALYGT